MGSSRADVNAALLQKKRQYLRLMEEKRAYLETHRYLSLFPDEGPLRRELYPKHMQFFEAQAKVHSVLALSANGVGKSLSMGGYSVVLHASGLYPDWWPGFRYAKPTEGWVAGATRETTRDIQQQILLGKIGQFGTGLIPRECIDHVQMRQNGGGAVDWVRIKHASGGFSVIGFKSYEQGVDSFYGTNKDWFWLDEIVPLKIFSECMARTRDSVWPLGLVTFTPLEGITDTVRHFVVNTEDQDKRAVIVCGWDDVPHLTEEWKAQTLADTPEYLRDTRSKGTPGLGEGAVYPVQRSQIEYRPGDLGPIPDHWARVFAIDAGWNPTAALWGAHDRENDILYIYSEHYLGKQPAAVHAEAMAARGKWIPGVGDVAAINNNDGEQWIKKYRDDHGFNLVLADKSVETGIQEVYRRLTSGRLKVASTLGHFWQEYVAYHRKDGKIVKEFDHLMDCLRYLVMGLGRAKTRLESQGDDDSHVDELLFGRRHYAR